MTMKYIESMNELLDSIEKYFQSKNNSFDTPEMEAFFNNNLIVCIFLYYLLFS